MTAPVQEPTEVRQLGILGWGDRQLRRRPRLPVPAVLFIKVCEDDEPVQTGDKKFQFEISQDMNLMSLTRVESYVTTTGIGATTIQLRKVGIGDMLSTPCSIDSGELNSEAAATPPVIDPAEEQVSWVAGTGGDHISIDVDAAGSGAFGLGVMLRFE